MASKKSASRRSPSSKKSSASSSKRQTGKTSVFSLNTFWICVLIIFSWVICTMVLFSLGLVGSFSQEVLQLLVGSFSYGLLIFFMGYGLYWVLTLGKKKVSVRMMVGFGFLAAFWMMTNGLQQVTDTNVTQPFSILVASLGQFGSMSFTSSCGLLGALLATVFSMFFSRTGAMFFDFAFLILGILLIGWNWWRLLLTDRKPKEDTDTEKGFQGVRRTSLGGLLRWPKSDLDEEDVPKKEEPKKRPPRQPYGQAPQPETVQADASPDDLVESTRLQGQGQPDLTGGSLTEIGPDGYSNEEYDEQDEETISDRVGGWLHHRTASRAARSRAGMAKNKPQRKGIAGFFGRIADFFSSLYHRILDWVTLSYVDKDYDEEGNPILLRYDDRNDASMQGRPIDKDELQRLYDENGEYIEKGRSHPSAFSMNGLVEQRAYSDLVADPDFVEASTSADPAPVLEMAEEQTRETDIRQGRLPSRAARRRQREAEMRASSRVDGTAQPVTAAGQRTGQMAAQAMQLAQTGLNAQSQSQNAAAAALGAAAGGAAAGVTAGAGGAAAAQSQNSRSSDFSDESLYEDPRNEAPSDLANAERLPRRRRTRSVQETAPDLSSSAVNGTVKDMTDQLGEVKPSRKKAAASSRTPSSRENKPVRYEAEPLDLSPKADGYVLPPISLLQEMKQNRKSTINQKSAAERGETLIRILQEFGVEASLGEIHIGPSVTEFEVIPGQGVRVNTFVNLQNDIKMALAAKDIRVEAPIPGKSAVGIEVPNEEKTTVSMRELIAGIPKSEASHPLLFTLGKDLMGENIYGRLDRMPHLLIAGATGSGKSVCVNSIICSLLMRTHPDEVKLLLIDPKKVEFTPFNGIPHLLSPVITDPALASGALKIIVDMMDERYSRFEAVRVRNLAGYNEYVRRHPKEELQKMPRIVVIIDELADLMLAASKDVEQSIQRITQLARAAGIHLIVATQRPSVNVITGVIKANIPSRIAFMVSSRPDSRTILDQSGAEKLLGYGDMLFLDNGATSPKRIQGVFIQDQEVEAICDYVRQQAQPEYEETFLLLKETKNNPMDGESFEEDPLYNEIRNFVIVSKKASTSLIQRRFRIGYARSARVMDQLEANGVIGPSQGSRPREVLISSSDDMEEDYE